MSESKNKTEEKDSFKSGIEDLKPDTESLEEILKKKSIERRKKEWKKNTEEEKTERYEFVIEQMLDKIDKLQEKKDSISHEIDKAIEDKDSLIQMLKLRKLS